MRDLALLVLAAAGTRAVAVALRLAGYARTSEALGRLAPHRGGEPMSAPESARRAREVIRLVAQGARGPFRASCLPRALVASALLAREGIGSVVRIGVRRDRDGLLAHAWVEHSGEPVAEPGDVAVRFAPFDRDFRGGTPRAT